MFIPILSAVTVLFCALTIHMRRVGKSFNGMVCKFFSSFCFMSVAFIGFCLNMKNPIYFCLVIFGLLFGLGGDVLLGIKEIAPKFKTKLIAMGTVSFMIGHIFFAAAFLKHLPKFSFIPFIITAIITIGAAIVIKLVKMQLKTPMYIMVVIYYFLITLGAALSGWIFFNTLEFTFLIAFIASVLFVVSDSILGFVYFTPTKRRNTLVTAELATYYTGQILMAVTVYLIK